MPLILHALITTQAGDARYYQWTAEGGTIANPDPSLPNVTINWNPSAPTKTLTLTPYSILDAKGDETSITVDIQNTFTNTWTASSGTWSDKFNWSLNVLPETCHQVVMPSQGSAVTINVPTGTISEFKTMTNGANINITLEGNAQLIVKE